MSRFLFALAACAAFATATFAQASAAAPILIKSCSIVKPKPLSHVAGGTQIVYANLGHKTAASVTFAVAYRNAQSHFVRKVTDFGSFAPGAVIDHKFSLYNDVTYAGTHAQFCVPTSVKWADHTVWITPTKP
jgi:hypothetical protein